MKKIFVLMALLCFSLMPVSACEKCNCAPNTTKAPSYTSRPLTKAEKKQAEKIIKELHKETQANIAKGYGPFLAAIYDKNGNLIAKMPNTVLKDNCSLNHAEVNTIKEAQKKLGTYDLAPYDLSIYINAEPCIMCMGAIMWSGIKHIYYSVDSKDVEVITGFDEGYKPNWIPEFNKRHIDVYGEIETDMGKQVLQEYVKSGKTIYKPSRT